MGISDLPVEEVPVVGDKDVGLRLVDVLKPPLDKSGLKQRRTPLRPKPHAHRPLLISAYLKEEKRPNMYTSTTYLIWLIKHCKGSLVLRFRGELKILNVLRDNFSVCNEKTLKSKTVR